MIRTATRVTALLLMLLAPVAAAASDGVDDFPRIRTTDLRLQALLAEGVLRSATLRALVARIAVSDVVVYVMCDGDPRARIAGRLTFISAVGGIRYVAVRLAPLRSRAQQIAILAHELQHAVEVADAPSIVDSESLGREYLRIGHINPHSTAPGVAFDTRAAVAAGLQVLDELSTMTED